MRKRLYFRGLSPITKYLEKNREKEKKQKYKNLYIILKGIWLVEPDEYQ
jgi:hypothetical protein